MIEFMFFGVLIMNRLTADKLAYRELVIIELHVLENIHMSFIRNPNDMTSQEFMLESNFDAILTVPNVAVR